MICDKCQDTGMVFFPNEPAVVTIEEGEGDTAVTVIDDGEFGYCECGQACIQPHTILF